jgi:hypothetical protein
MKGVLVTVHTITLMDQFEKGILPKGMNIRQITPEEAEGFFIPGQWVLSKRKPRVSNAEPNTSGFSRGWGTTSIGSGCKHAYADFPDSVITIDRNGEMFMQLGKYRACSFCGKRSGKTTYGDKFAMM